MNIAAKSDFNFQGKALVPVSNIAGVWFTSADLASALKYSNSRAVTMLYNKYADEFSSGMSQVLEVSTSGNYRKKVRVFSLRGAHLIAMFARSDVAKEFRRWVLDILDQEVAQGSLSPLSYQVLCRVENGKQVSLKMFDLDSVVEDVNEWQIWMRHYGAVFLFSEDQKREFFKEQVNRYLN